MSALPAPVLPRVAQLIRLFGSDHDGEKLGAVRAIGRTLATNGGSYADLADLIERGPEVSVVFRDKPERSPPNDPAWSNSGRTIVAAKLLRAIQDGVLTAWEIDFAASIVGQISASRTWRPTPKQETRLDALIAKLHAAGVWF